MTVAPRNVAPGAQGPSDWELWACAAQQIGRHGEFAPEAAAIQADALLDAGDLEGHRTWLAILARIRHLSGPMPGERRQ